MSYDWGPHYIMPSEVMGLMHVFVKKDNTEIAIARDNIVEISIEN